jgi:hypothetical protein
MITLARTGLMALALVGAAGAASAATLVDNATQGRYNSSIGTVLNGTDPFFVSPGGGDPTVTLGPSQAPDLSAASAALGTWLSTPSSPGGSWSVGPVSIPSNWSVQHETAIIYEIDGGATGFTDVSASFGVDNGILVWLNGMFIGGAQRPGGPVSGEHQFALGTLGSGTNYLQVMREDHGGGTGYDVSVTGNVAPIPLPAAGLMMIAGLGGLAAIRRRP